MTTLEIVRVFRGRRSGKGKWRCVCPIHGGKHSGPLIISEQPDGNTGIYCFGGCDTKAILLAVGLSMSDLFRESRKVTPEIRQRMANEDRLKVLETRLGAYILNQAIDSSRSRYWAKCEENVRVEIAELEFRMLPPIEAGWRRNEEKFHASVAKHGHERIVDAWLKTPRGKAIADRYGLDREVDAFPNRCLCYARPAGMFTYWIPGLPESAGKFAGERGIPIVEVGRG